MAKKLGLVSMVGVPLQLKDEKVIGVLNCFTAEPYDFSSTEVNLLRAVANQAAVALLNTELMVTEEGREASYVTNILSHFLLTEGLAEHDLFGADPVIVNMTSGGIGKNDDSAKLSAER